MRKLSRRSQILRALHVLTLWLSFLLTPQLALARPRTLEVSTFAILEFFHTHGLRAIRPLNRAQGLGQFPQLSVQVSKRDLPRKIPQAIESAWTEKALRSLDRQDQKMAVSIRPLGASRGYGLFANRNFKAGEVLGLYAGTVLQAPSASGQPITLPSWLRDTPPKDEINTLDWMQFAHDGPANCGFVGSWISYRDFLRLADAVDPTDDTPENLWVAVVSVETLQPIQKDQQVLGHPTRAYWKTASEKTDEDLN